MLTSFGNTDDFAGLIRTSSKERDLLIECSRKTIITNFMHTNLYIRRTYVQFMSLNEKDSELLVQLTKNGKASQRELARETGVALGTVNAHIKQLEKNKVNDEDTKKELIKVEVLPKKLDEEVASYMVEGFGGVMTKLSSEQADYINVPEEGPFKSDIYKY